MQALSIGAVEIFAILMEQDSSQRACCLRFCGTSDPVAPWMEARAVWNDRRGFSSVEMTFGRCSEV